MFHLRDLGGDDGRALRPGGASLAVAEVQPSCEWVVGVVDVEGPTAQVFAASIPPADQSLPAEFALHRQAAKPSGDGVERNIYSKRGGATATGGATRGGIDGRIDVTEAGGDALLSLEVP